MGATIKTGRIELIFLLRVWGNALWLAHNNLNEHEPLVNYTLISLVV